MLHLQKLVMYMFWSKNWENGAQFECELSPEKCSHLLEFLIWPKRSFIKAMEPIIRREHERWTCLSAGTVLSFFVIIHLFVVIEV